MKFYFWSIILALFVLPLDLAQARQPKDFFARMYVGTGFGAFTDDGEDGSKFEYEGNAGMISFTAGHSIRPKLNLHLGFSTNVDNNPNVKRNGQRVKDVASEYGLGALTGGVSYYPGWGIYIAPEFRYVFSASERFGATTTRFTGMGVGVSLGKEGPLDSRFSWGWALIYVRDVLDGDKIMPPEEVYKGEGKHSYFGLALSFVYD